MRTSFSGGSGSDNVENAPLLVLAGPTGVGKTEVSIDLARAVGGEIVNYDSIQLYRGFDIGSAKPSARLRRELPHHLFDVIDATEEYTAARYAADADAVCGEVISRERVPILVGGTFFYLRALLHGLPEMPPRSDSIRQRLDRIHRAPRGTERLRRWLSRVDPVSASKVAANDWHRLQRALEVHLLAGRPISSWTPPGSATPRRVPALVFGLQMDRETLRKRIDARTLAMYKAGLLEETSALLSRYPATARPFGAIGYAEAVRVLRGEISEPEAIAETTRRTRAYAKRQMTWLRGETGVVWIDATLSRSAIIEQIINEYQGAIR